MKKHTGSKYSAALKYSFYATLPVFAGYIFLGMGFGILLGSSGYGWWWALLMSCTIYAGSMQYAAVDLLTSGATVLSTVIVTVLIQIRHLFYGISMAEKYKGTGIRKAYLAFSLTDETFALVCNPSLPEEVDQKLYYYFVSVLDQCYWIAGCTLGAVIGRAFTFNTEGIEFVMTALFVVILTDQWEKTKQHLPAVTGIVITVICLVILGPSRFLIPSMAGITLALFLERPWIGEEKKDD